MKILAIYDNLGQTLNRYTIVFEERRKQDGTWFYMCLGLSAGYQGKIEYSQFGECVRDKHLGKKIKLGDLSEDLRNHIEMRMNEN